MTHFQQLRKVGLLSTLKTRCVDGVLELRYFETRSSNRFLSWKLDLDEARDLARWWTSHGERILPRDLPIRQIRAGGVLISMFALGFLDARGLDKLGRPKMHGYSLPREVVELLAIQMAKAQRERKPSGQKAVE